MVVTVLLSLIWKIPVDMGNRAAGHLHASRDRARTVAPSDPRTTHSPCLRYAHTALRVDRGTSVPIAARYRRHFCRGQSSLTASPCRCGWASPPIAPGSSGSRPDLRTSYLHRTEMAGTCDDSSAEEARPMDPPQQQRMQLVLGLGRHS